MQGADEDLVAALYDEYAGALHAYAFRFLHDRGKAEDVVQEVLLRAWRHPARLDPALGSPRGWLFTVARNVLTDTWRASRARPREAALDDAVQGLAVDDQIDRLLETWTVELALDRLSRAHRQVLVEVFLLGRSVAQTADDLGIPEGTVKSRTHHGLRALRVALSDLGVE